jgi:DNA-directed RNA polymerase specialized sigma24 family protein
MAERNRRGGPRDQARGAASRSGANKVPPGKQGQSIPPGKQAGKQAGKQTGKQAGKRATSRDAADGVDERAAQLAEPLRRVLQRLPETQRRVLELRMGLVDGHPQDPADAARTLGMSLGELREIETRAFERIREVIPLQQLQRFLER